MTKKKTNHHFEIYLGIALVVVIILSTTPLRKEAEERIETPPHKEQMEKFDPSKLKERNQEVIEALDLGNIDKLSDFAHPEKGIRFSPYTYIDVDKDKVFSAEELKNISGDNNIYDWGAYDGTGEPIKLSFTEYYQKFIYNHDFIEAPDVDFNDPIGESAMINNLEEVYPESEYVEYHFPGFEEQYEGMDWQSLRLIYEQNSDEIWYLVGIVHAQWTT